MSHNPTTISFQRIKSQDGKDLNLFTSLYYHLTVKSIPNGIMSFETETRQEGHLIELALNNLDDFVKLSEDNNYYEIAGPLAPNALWNILPEVNSKDNEYQLKVMSHPEGKLTYTHGSSWGGRYMELDLTNPEHYNPGANMYSSCLWYFRPSEFPEYYTIHNSDPRRDPNFVTFSNEPSERGQLMQLGTKDLENYALHGTFRQDALWQFKPKNYQLFAHITNFTFEEPTDSQISEEAYPIAIGGETFSSTNPETRVNFSAEIPETYKLNFMQSFKPFHENNIRIDSSFFDGKRQLKFLQGKPLPLHFEKKPGSNTQFVCLRNTEVKIQQEFKFPQEENFETLRVKGYCNVVKEMEIPFTAMVKITAKADVSDSRNGLKIENVTVDSTQVIQHFLKFEKFTGKIKDAKSCNKKSDNCDNGVVNCEVGGRFKCTCAIDTYLDVKMMNQAKI